MRCTEPNALYRARGLRDGAARKAEVMANGTEKAKRILKNTEKYVEDGFGPHGRKIQAALNGMKAEPASLLRTTSYHNSPWTRLPVS
jgi:hypothetical protein